MKTLVCLDLQLLYITRTSPWIDRSPLLYPKTQDSPSSLPIKTWKLHTQGKGFGGSKPVSRQNESVRSTSNGDDDGDDDDKIPEAVFKRLVARILISAGTPMAIGVTLLLLFGTLKDQHVWDVPLWIPSLTTLVTFGVSVLGIPYGALSTSWDPAKKGSVIGWEVAQQNWPELWREEDEGASDN